MAPLIVLFGAFLLALLVLWLIQKQLNYSLAGRIALAVMLVITGISHFILTAGMSLMLPDFLPMKTEIIYLTGVIEVLAATGLLLPNTARLTGILLIIFFVCILPSNILAAINHVNIRQAGNDGPGIASLWFRVPLQVFFIAWTYWFAVRERPQHHGSFAIE